MKIKQAQLLDDNSFVKMIPLDVTIVELMDHDWTSDPVSIRFEAVIEKQSWGINRIWMNIPPQTIQVEVKGIDMEGNEKTIPLTFDPSNMEIQTSSGSHVTLEEIKVVARMDGRILYHQCLVSGTTLLG